MGNPNIKVPTCEAEREILPKITSALFETSNIENLKNVLNHLENT